MTRILTPATSGLSRRDFLKLAGVGLGGLALPRWTPRADLPDFPENDALGRVAVGMVEIYARPDDSSEVVGKLYEDAVVPWLKEIVGKRPMNYIQRFVQIPDGYVFAAQLQPVRNLPNQPVTSLPQNGDKPGMWVEVTVPYADILNENPAYSPWLKNSPLPRVYYSQILWVDQIRTGSDGLTYYRVNERYGSYGDIYWVDGRAFRPLTAEDVAPISPEVEDKRVEVDVTYQTMACYEGNTEVFFTRVSTGAKFDMDGNRVDKWSTPVGPHPIWRKLVSVHMSGGSTGGGYDLPGIGWTSLFSGEGVAVHSTFWHNAYGVPMSHGCVNAAPEDAKFVFRWTQPQVGLEPGDVTISGKGSTKIVVVEK